MYPPQPPQFPTNDPSGGQYPGGQYPGGQFQPGQYPPQYAMGQGGMYPPQGPPPSKSRAVIWSLVAVGVVVVVLLTVVLLVAPWKKSDQAETFELDRAINVHVMVPAGWNAQAIRENGISGVLIMPDSDSRSSKKIDEARADLREGRSADPVHYVYIDAESCSSSDKRTWDLNPVTRTDVGKAQLSRRSMSMRVAGSDCVGVYGIDLDSTKPDPTATDMILDLSKDDKITASQDDSRPSVEPSY